MYDITTHSFVPERPMCIDLDGTLIENNSLRNIFKKSSLSVDLFYPFRWPMIKEKLTLRNSFDVDLFHYYLPLVNCLHQWKSQGVPLFLVTGAHEKTACAIAKKLGCFQEVWASNSSNNLVGKRKAEHLTNRFGQFGFTYVGDSWRDLPVWKYSHHIVTVTKPAPFLKSYLKIWKHKTQKIFII